MESFLWPPASSLNQRGQTWHAACKGGPNLRFPGCQLSVSVTQWLIPGYYPWNPCHPWLPRFRAGLISSPYARGRAAGGRPHNRWKSYEPDPVALLLSVV